MTVHLISANSGADSAGAYDMQISSASPTTNYGTGATAYVDVGGFRIIYGFDIPAGLSGATVNSATFSVYNRFGDVSSLSLYKLRRVPGEATTTWNKYDGTNDWSTAGALNTSTDYNSTALATKTSGSSSAYEGFTDAGTFASTVQAAIGGTLWLVLDGSAYFSTHTKEAADTFRPKLSIDYTAGGGSPTVTTVSSNSATEGSSIVHTVTLSAAVTGSAASYAITLAGGTATGGGTDYTSTLTNGMFSNSVTVSGGNISVPVGVSTFTVTVSTAGDTIDEANETYTLTIGGTAGTGTINDDDAAPVITVGDAPSVTAGSPAIFTISLDRAKSTSITVDAACVNGTLVGGVGYTSDLSLATISNGVTFGAGALTIPAGVTSFTVSIPTAA